VPGLNRQRLNASMVASSKSLFPVLFSILAEMTQPVSLLISTATMPRPVGRRPCASTGYRGRGAKIATALAFLFAADERVVCAEAREIAITNAMMKNRGFIGCLVLPLNPSFGQAEKVAANSSSAQRRSWLLQRGLRWNRRNESRESK
jgi:hypothetical protein